MLFALFFIATISLSSGTGVELSELRAQLQQTGAITTHSEAALDRLDSDSGEAIYRL